MSDSCFTNTKIKASATLQPRARVTNDCKTTPHDLRRNKIISLWERKGQTEFFDFLLSSKDETDDAFYGGVKTKTNTKKTTPHQYSMDRMVLYATRWCGGLSWLRFEYWYRRTRKVPSPRAFELGTMHSSKYSLLMTGCLRFVEKTFCPFSKFFVRFATRQLKKF